LRQLDRDGALSYPDASLAPKLVRDAVAALERSHSTRDPLHLSKVQEKHYGVVKKELQELFLRRKWGKHYVEEQDRVDYIAPSDVNLPLRGPEKLLNKTAAAAERKLSTCRKRKCGRVFGEAEEDEAEDGEAWVGCDHCEFWLCPTHADELPRHKKHLRTVAAVPDEPVDDEDEDVGQE